MNDNGQNALVALEAASNSLAKCCDLTWVSDFTDQAKKIAALATVQKYGLDWHNRAKIMWITAEARMGELLAELKKSGHLRSKKGRPKKNVPSETFSAEELNLRRKQIGEAQKLAAIPAKTREKYFRQAQDNGEEISKQGLKRFVSPPKPKAKAEPKEDQPPEAPTEAMDHFGVYVPDKLVPVFVAAVEFRRVQKAISDAKSAVKKLSAVSGGARLDEQEVTRTLDTAHRLLRFAMPYTECAKCRRRDVRTCPACKGSGWVHETLYKTSFTDDDKRWIESR